MSLSYQIDEGTHTIRVVGEGTFDVTHCEEFARAVAAELASRPGWPIVADCRELVWIPWPSEVRQVAMVLGELRSAYTGPVAIVLSRPVVFGLARMLATLVEPFGVRMMPFWEPLQAETWCMLESTSDTTTPVS